MFCMGKKYLSLQVSDEDQIIFWFLQKSGRRSTTQEFVGRETILSPPQRTFLFASLVIWCGGIFAYYGIMMCAGSWGDIYLSSAISCCIDIPGYIAIWWMYDNWGRRKPSFWCYFLAGVFSVACAVLDDGAVKTACAIIAKR